MEEAQSTINLDLLAYWQENAWRLKFNQGFLTPQEMPPFITLDAVQSTDINGPVWLAMCLRESMEKAWIPLLIPAECLQGKLALRHKVAFPYFPPYFFEPSAKLHLKHRALHESFLRDQCTNEQGQYLFQDFTEFQQATLTLFAQLLGEPDWQVACDALGFESVEWRVFAQSDLDQPPFIEQNCVKSFSKANVSTYLDEIDEHNFFDFAHLLQAQSTQQQILDQNTIKNLLSILSLKVGQMQAIKAPIGTSADQLIEHIVANQFTLQALGKKQAPVIAVCHQNATFNKQYFDSTRFESEALFIEHCQHYLDNDQLTDCAQIKQAIQQKMLSKYENNLNAMSLMRTYMKAQQDNVNEYGGVEKFLHSLAEEDEQNDAYRHKYLDIYQQWERFSQTQSVLQKCISWIPLVKKIRQKKAAQFLDSALRNEPVDIPYDEQLIEQIRALKVKQAKNDQKRIKAVGFLDQLQKAKKNWQAWVQKQDGEISASDLDMTALFQLLNNLHQSLWALCALYWQADSFEQHPNVAQSPVDTLPRPFRLDVLHPVLGPRPLSSEETIDLLFIDGAHQLTPAESLALLAKAKRAVAFGDNLAVQALSLVSPELEAQLLKQYDVSETEHETLQANGQSLNLGSTFKVIQFNSAQQKLSSCGLYQSAQYALKSIAHKNEELFNFWNDQYLYRSLQLEQTLISQAPAFEMVSVSGRLNCGINIAEVEAVLEYLKQNTMTNALLVTPFYNQQQLLSKLLPNHISVVTFQDLPPNPVSTVLYSPCYTRNSQRPFVHDEGDAYFYSLLALASERLLIIGDQKIFDAKLHSASGKIAKWQKNVNSKLEVDVK